MEAQIEKRAKYLKAMESAPKAKLVYIDESGIDMNICKDRGWGHKSKILYGKKSGKHYQRTNIVAGLTNNEAIAPFVFNGSCNTELFNDWIEQFLIKEVNPGQIVVMDNESFHKSARTRELIESVGCTPMFLPPYSPDLNPIEKFWANMKRWIKGKMTKVGELYEVIVEFFAIPN